MARPTGLGKRLPPGATVSGNAPTRLFGTAERSANTPDRLGLQIANHDLTRAIYVRLLPANEELVELGSSVYDFLVPPRATLVLAMGAGIDVLVQNDSGGATTSEISAVELR